MDKYILCNRDLNGTSSQIPSSDETRNIIPRPAKTTNSKVSTVPHGLSQWINPVYTSTEPRIPLLETISTKQSITITLPDLLTAKIINQIDRKFILISIPQNPCHLNPPSAADIKNGNDSYTLAVIDQHAADERYRLERLIEQLRYTSKVVDPAINIPMSERHLHTLLKRREVLLQWGIEITIEKSGVISESEMSGIVELTTSERQGTLQEMGVLLLRVIPEITKDLDAAKWKQILLQYLSEEKSQLPSLLTQILASKACRSVPPGLPREAQPD